MGMAASQARLLTLTARMHDIEYQAQSIQNAKLQLATQSDKVYEDYLAALDATTLTVLTINSAGNKSNVAATFNNLCSVNKAQTANGATYALFDSKGRLIVEDNVATGYKDFQNSPLKDMGAYGFAMFMMGIQQEKQDGNGSYGIEDAELDAYNAIGNKGTNLTSLYSTALKALQEFDPDAEDIYDTDKALSKNKETDEYTYDTDKSRDSYFAALEAFRRALYSSHSEEVYNQAKENLGPTSGNNPIEYNDDTFNHYVSVYNQIQVAGGYIPISQFDDPLGSNNIAANNTEWLQAMIACGKITIDVVKTDKDGKTIFNATSTSSDDVIGETTTTSIDSSALAKAEAKYEHDLKNIDRKDKEFDMSLSKLETEREALKTQYESTKKVIETNVGRTFNIFNS